MVVTVQKKTEVLEKMMDKERDGAKDNTEAIKKNKTEGIGQYICGSINERKR